MCVKGKVGVEKKRMVNLFLGEIVWGAVSRYLAAVPPCARIRTRLRGCARVNYIYKHLLTIGISCLIAYIDSSTRFGTGFALLYT